MGCLRRSSHRTLLSVVACVVTFLVSGGLVQGVTGLLTILEKDHVYEDECPVVHPDCNARANKLQRIAWLGFLSLTAGQLVLGVVLDFAGPKLTAVVGLIIEAVGFAGLAFTHVPSGQWLLGPAYFLTGFGGVGPYIAAMNFGNLFAQPGVFVSFNTGMFVASGWVYLGLQELFLSGIGRVYLFSAYGVLCIVFACVCGVLYPVSEYKEGDEATLSVCMPCTTAASLEGGNFRVRDVDEGGDGLGAPPTARAESSHASVQSGLRKRRMNSGLSSIVAELDKQPEPSFWCAVATPHFIGFGLWFGLQLLVQSFYASAIKNILLRKGDTTGVYADVFDIVSNLGFMFNPLIGVWLAKKGYALVLALTIIAGQGYLAVTFAASLPVQVVGFALLAVQRSLMFTSFYSYIAVGFDARMYGRLLGVLCVYGTVIGASQTALSHMALQTDHGDYSRVMYLQIGLMCTLYAWAVLVGWRESKAADSDGSDTMQRRREHSFNIAERAPTLRGHKQPEPLLNGPLSGASSYYSYAS